MAQSDLLEQLMKNKSSSKKKFKEKETSVNPEYYKKKALKKYNISMARKEGIKKARQQLYQQQVQKRYIATSTKQISLQEQQAQARQRKIGFMGSRAEQLEIQAVSFNEVPMLHDMERQRTRLTSPPHFAMERIERSVTDSFPD